MPIPNRKGDMLLSMSSGPLVKRERGATAALLLLVMALHFAFAGASQSPGHQCGHQSCPKRRPAGSEHMRCQGQAPAAASCSVRAGCDCGRTHLPFAPHRQIEAVLPSIVSILTPDPFQNLLLPVDGARFLVIRGPDAPPPRLRPA